MFTLSASCYIFLADVGIQLLCEFTFEGSSTFFAVAAVRLLPEWLVQNVQGRGRSLGSEIGEVVIKA